MKCQQCEKPATFHITELTGEDVDREVQEVHLCEDCAKIYLSQGEDTQQKSASLAGALAQQFKVGEAAEDLARLDQRACPVCGITFYEFRHVGRLGCPHDYICFEKELEPLIVNIHGDSEHIGKTPKFGSGGTDEQTELIRLRREMKEAVEAEHYEEASKMRDRIQEIEEQAKRA
jgi:protein arginine kinase activator